VFGYPGLKDIKAHSDKQRHIQGTQHPQLHCRGSQEAESENAARITAGLRATRHIVPKGHQNTDPKTEALNDIIHLCG